MKFELVMKFIAEDLSGTPHIVQISTRASLSWARALGLTMMKRLSEHEPLEGSMHPETIGANILAAGWLPESYCRTTYAYLNEYPIDVTIYRTFGASFNKTFIQLLEQLSELHCFGQPSLFEMMIWMGILAAVLCTLAFLALPRVLNEGLAMACVETLTPVILSAPNLLEEQVNCLSNKLKTWIEVLELKRHHDHRLLQKVKQLLTALEKFEIEFRCPIDHTIMGDPISFASTGQTFGRQGVTAFFNYGGHICPVTKNEIKELAFKHDLVTNYMLRNHIQSCFKKFVEQVKLLDTHVNYPAYNPPLQLAIKENLMFFRAPQLRSSLLAQQKRETMTDSNTALSPCREVSYAK